MNLFKISSRNKNILLIIFLSFLLFSLNFVLSFSSWTISNGDIHRTGSSDLKGNISNPVMMWEYTYPPETSNYMQNPVLVDDINNDGIMEACSGAKDGYVRCFNALNGTEIWNYSIPGIASNLGGVSLVIANFYNDSQRQILQGDRAGILVVLNGTNGEQLWNFTNSSSFIIDSSFSHDILGDSNQEVLFKTSYGVFVFHANGTQIWNYSFPFGYQGAGFAIGDIVSSGEDKIIFGHGDNITVLNYNGSFVKTFLLEPEFSPYGYSFSGMSLIDFNNDGFLDVVACSDNGYIYGINNSLNLVWKKLVSNNYLSARTSVGDIDGDSKPELVTSSYDYGIKTFNLEDGSPLWTYSALASTTNSPTIVDIDNDGDLEILETYLGSFIILNGKYGYLENSLRVNTQAHYSSFSVADVDDDGFVEIFSGGRNFPNAYPPEYRNKIYAISSGSAVEAGWYKNSSILENDSLNWKTESKNTLLNKDIPDYLGSASPVLENLIELTNLNYSLIGDDLEGDGILELFIVSGNNLYCFFQNGTLKWNSSFEKPLVASPTISDADDDGVDEILILANDTIFLVNASSGNSFWNYTHDSGNLNLDNVYSLDFDGDSENEFFYFFHDYYNSLISVEFNKSVRWLKQFSGLLSEDMTIYDFNKDGILDLLFSSSIGQVAIGGLEKGMPLISSVVQGKIVHSSILDINNDGYTDVVVGTENMTYLRNNGGYTGYKPYGGNQSGIFGLIYNNSIPSLTESFYYESENVTGGIATSDLNNNGYSEIIFGDISNKIYVISSTGSLVWELNLGENILYPPMVLRVDDAKIVIATSNDTLFFINSTGNLFYSYNSTSNFTYSPIILDLNKDCKGEVIFAEIGGNVSYLNFATSTNQLVGNLTINVSQGSYQPKTLGKSLCSEVTIDLDSYSSEMVNFFLDGSNDVVIGLDSLTPSTEYEIKVTQSGCSSSSYHSTDSKGFLSISYENLGPRYVEIFPYLALEESVSSGFPLFKPSSEQLKEGYLKLMGKNWKINFDFQDESYELKIDDVQNDYVTITVSGESQTFNLSINKTQKLDLNNDGYYDFQVSLNSIQINNYANLEFKEIHEKVPAEEQEKQKEPSKIKEEIKNWMWIVSGIVLLIIIGIIIRKLWYEKKKVKKKKK